MRRTRAAATCSSATPTSWLPVQGRASVARSSQGDPALVRPAGSSPAWRRSSDQIRGVSDTGSPLVEAELIRQSPLNEHYLAALSLAAIVLEGAGLAHAPGDVDGTSFL